MTQLNTNTSLEGETKKAPDLNTPEGQVAHNVGLAMSNPAAVPAKFKKEDGTIDLDLLTASYVELEQKLSGKEVTPATTAPVTDPAVTAATIEDQLKEGDQKTEDKAVTMEDILRGEQTTPEGKSVVDWKKVENEMRSTGRLSNETIKSLEDSGVPREMIAVSINGIKLKQKEDMDRAAALLGGADELSATLNWAKTNLNEAQRKTIIEQLNSPMGEQILLGLHAQYTAAQPKKEGTLIDTSIGGGGGAAPSGVSSEFGAVTPFTDFREQQAAMGDVRYSTNPSYRQWVAMRLIASRGGDHTKLIGRSV